MQTIHADHGNADLLATLEIQCYNPRYTNLEAEHESSCEWIMKVQEPNPGFRSWLQSPGSLFWVSGKPGCGKSTLMKYTLKILQAQPEILSLCDPTIISFFFYQQGQQQEKSFTGLLHSLVY
jgi:type II secretory ATPase GspE/PulE/Tfp pilus assembly ATPase PilB-like protein